VLRLAFRAVFQPLQGLGVVSIENTWQEKQASKVKNMVGFEKVMSTV
jgi:hypothetical protein